MNSSYSRIRMSVYLALILGSATDPCAVVGSPAADGWPDVEIFAV